MINGHSTRPDKAAITLANNAPAFDDATAEFMVDENMPVGTDVGMVMATDEDGDPLTYSVDSMYFAIDDMSGQITTAMSLDHEAMSSHTVTVTADDDQDKDNTATITVTIMVNDVPEGACAGGAAVADMTNTGLLADCDALLNIMGDLVGDGTAPNWSADLAMSEWDGVAGTGTGRVTHIYLRDSGLAGEIPAGITALDALKKLTLTDNDLTGEIPDLSGLDNIQVLVLGGNAFTGGIPASLGNLESLLRLWLHRNDGGFEGGIPAELGSLPNLRYLMLYGNDLTGGIPSELGDATNLKALYLHNNMLTGSIPAELGNLTGSKPDDTLRLLYLQNNMLSGDVPAELGNLVSLTKLRLGGNMLIGCIPAAIAGAAEGADAGGLMACADDGS